MILFSFVDTKQIAKDYELIKGMHACYAALYLTLSVTFLQTYIDLRKKNF